MRRQRASRLPAHRYDGGSPTDRNRAEPPLRGSYHPRGGAPASIIRRLPFDPLSSTPASWLSSSLVGAVEPDPEPSVARSRVLLPGPRNEAPVRARRDVLRSLLRPVISPHVERSLRVCVARRTRKQVMFARGVAGRRGIVHYRRTPSSAYSCP